MWGPLGIILSIVGGLGVIYQCYRFVREKIPANYGNNPGFGCLEVMIAPWHASGSLGLGLLMQSWGWGVGVFGLGLLGFGLLAMLLGQLFGGQ